MCDKQLIAFVAYSRLLWNYSSLEEIPFDNSSCGRVENMSCFYFSCSMNLNVISSGVTSSGQSKDSICRRPPSIVLVKCFRMERV